MLFNSFQFIIFFPVVVLITLVLPDRFRMYWLLGASYFFYMSWKPEYGMLLLLVTVISWGAGLLIERENQPGEKTGSQKRKKTVLLISIFAVLGLLIYFKYLSFLLGLVRTSIGLVGVSANIPVIEILLPVGISFFVFQSVGYMVDVYRAEIKAEKNFFRYALFVSFFPQLVAGPIERSKNLLKQLSGTPFLKADWEMAKDGFLLILWGYFLKMVIADRVAILVDRIYGDPTGLFGWYLIIATILFAVQIYCDFAGYSYIAIGCAQILGIQLMENFDSPYLSGNVSEFWRRWHISLNTWFRDYLYIPLGGNRCGKVRKYFNVMVVFMLSGLWHGASLSYIVWGSLNGIYQVVYAMTKRLRKRMIDLLGIHPEKEAYRIIRIVFTFMLIDFAWIFFRAKGIHAAIYVIKQMLHLDNPWVLFDGSLYSLGVSHLSFDIMLLSIGILIFSDICKYRHVCIRKVILRQDRWVRYIFYTVTILVILVFGIWGGEETMRNFVYFQF